MTGFRTLLYKEVLRFWKVSLQTVAAPVLTAMLYVLIFSNLLEGKADVYPGVSYPVFLVPGLAIMAALQNAFANSSSSLIQSKMTGNVIFVLLSPISNFEFLSAYVLASILRGLIVSVGVLAISLPLWSPAIREPVWLAAFFVLGTGTFGALGLVAAIVVDKIDQMAAFQNFIILPLTFLSGVFFSVHALSEFWESVSYLNPVFYMVDGIRFGIFGVSDVSPAKGLVITGICLLAVGALAFGLIARGYKLRS
jgi:ABC-2 type transport system permease protein